MKKSQVKQNTNSIKHFSNYLAKYLNEVIDGIAEAQAIQPIIGITPEMIENGIRKYN